MEKCKGCNKINKCEINLFLKDFINQTYKVNLEDLQFECCDKTGDKPSQPEIAVCINGEDIVIEAKTLGIEVITKMKTFIAELSDKIKEVIRDSSKCKNILGQNYSKILYEILSKFGIHISFNEGILFLSPILHGKDKQKVLNELIGQILINLIKAVSSIIKRGEKYIQYPKTMAINLDEFSPRIKERSNLKHYKTSEYGSLEKYDRKIPCYMNSCENTQITKADIWYENVNMIDRTYLSVIGDKTELILEISLTGKVGEVTTGNISQMVNWYNNDEMKKYYTNRLKDTVKKFKNCKSTARKILFFNSDLIRICIGQTDTLKDTMEIIKEISNKEDYKLIDEIWVEYYLGKDVGDDLNFAIISYSDRKYYERIK